VQENEKKVLANIDQDFAIKTTMELVRRVAWQDYTKPSSEWEWERALYIQNKLIELGCEVVPIAEVGEVSYRRPNIIGFLRGSEKGQPALSWTAHIDTHAPPAFMDYPGDSYVENGEVKGLGTGDQLGAIGAIFTALDAIKRQKIQLKRDLMIFFTSDEMEGARGAELAHRWMKAKNVLPEFGIVAEPTDNQIGLAHTGINEFEIEVTGVTGHPSFKTKEISLPIHSPIVRMADVIKTLLEIEKKEERFKIEHPLTGVPYTWIGPIEGGTRPPGICGSGAPSDPLLDGMTSYEAFGHNIKCAHMQPEYCKLIFGARTIPRKIKPGEMYHTEAEKGTSNKEHLELINKHLKAMWQESPSATTYAVRRTSDRSIPWEISPDEPHVKLLVEIMKDVTGEKPRFLGAKYWTEAARCSEELGGAPFAIVAPTWQRFHRADEGIPITELMEASRIYAGIILGFCKTA